MVTSLNAFHTLLASIDADIVYPETPPVFEVMAPSGNSKLLVAVNSPKSILFAAEPATPVAAEVKFVIWCKSKPVISVPLPINPSEDLIFPTTCKHSVSYTHLRAHETR